MINGISQDYGRRHLDFKTPKVVEVLPEYFGGDYPQLISLLEAYNEFMDSDGNVNDDLRQVLKVRDVDGVSLKFLEYLIQEIGNGISINKFDDPREIVRNFPDFYRIKGSNFSAKSFFRALYGEEVEILYPKDNVFIVNESLIGAESLRYIQNGALYQTLSILIKSSRPISQWKDLYKRYVHPAGFYLGGEVLAEGVVNLSLNFMPEAIPDSDASAIQIFGIAELSVGTVFEPLSGFFQSYDSAPIIRRNLLTYTEEFDTANWVKSNTTVTPNSNISPDGLTTADLITSSGAAGYVFPSNTNIFSAAGGGTYTYSVYAKAGTATSITILVAASATYSGSFNLSTGIATTGTVNTNVSMVNVGNDWYRCIITCSAITDTVYTEIQNGRVASGLNFQIWGAQLELASTATDYQKVISDSEVFEIGDPNYVLNTYRVDLNRTLAGIWNDSASTVDSNYGSIINAATINTVGFDDSHYNGIDFSNVFETMDRSPFDSIGSNIWVP